VIEYSIQSDHIVVKVRVVPRASRSEIVGERDGALRVRIAAPAVDDAANEALIRLFARTFKVSRSAISILSGRASRVKHIRIARPGPDILATLSDLSFRKP
jgi:uncharacterized protein (TIGR00251 family)